MKHTILIFIIILLTSCSGKTTRKTDTGSNAKIDSVQKEEKLYNDDQLILGERIDGPANCRDSANGKTLFKLKDNVLVQTAPIKNNWIDIGLIVKLTGQQLDEYLIPPNTDLISSDGLIIGETIDSVDVWMAHDSIGIIGACTYIDNIKKLTKPENVLALEIDNDNLTKTSLEKFIKNFGLKEYENNSLPALNQFMIYESWIVDPSPRDRITLLFDSIGSLNGIIHSREINTSKFKQYNLVRGHSLTITSDMPDDQIQELIKDRIEYYSSTD